MFSNIYIQVILIKCWKVIYLYLYKFYICNDFAPYWNNEGLWCAELIQNSNFCTLHVYLCHVTQNRHLLVKQAYLRIQIEQENNKQFNKFYFEKKK